jgi:hypothetical protein
MKLAPPANPDEYLMCYGQSHGEPKPGHRADSPELSNLDSMDTSRQSQPDEKNSKQGSMKPLLFKDQLDLRHATLFQRAASELATHGAWSRRLKKRPVHIC